MSDGLTVEIQCTWVQSPFIVAYFKRAFNINRHMQCANILKKSNNTMHMSIQGSKRTYVRVGIYKEQKFISQSFTCGEIKGWNVKGGLSYEVLM